MPKEKNDNQIPSSAKSFGEERPEVDELKEALAIAEKQCDEYLAGWQRAKADFVNYKQDERKHFDDAVKYGIEGIMRDIIGVLDTFDFAIRAMEAKTGPTLAKGRSPDQDVGIGKGIYLIRSQIEDILKKRGLEKIEVGPGDLFDPAFMEAMMEIVSSHPPGTVVEVMEPGYRLYDKILRAARVVVSKGNEKLK